MVKEETICPYTGLRSFSEDESLYFKGRDAQISRVIQQLEERKFLMLTGASGDGKSSLIFAGLIPQARAGFFKAKYSNWKVVSFRPERSPLKNFSKGLADAFDREPGLIENELDHGFSSLTELYKSTSMFIDRRDTSTDEATQESKEREAGNLLIIVDQFEEFFTNPENFPNGVPSQDARLVLNILLETVKISLRDDLPIYVVFTMRSDYIGQCAAFRGLPEFIGFSQFFVPRLQRKELQEVIEEPAILSGNRISKRLIDRLIYDLDEAEDHLPMLQHVLKEMWKAADEGREEIDLIHYAMVGGMSGNELPKADALRFQSWKEKLLPENQLLLQGTGLSKVLDIHATRLYSEAAAAYNHQHEDQITEKQAKIILAITFACLTRIDENRAVRNRMTLGEITAIINIPNVTTVVVDGVLKNFRASSNTLVRPFIDDNGANEKLPPEAILDITHEALIRNWKLLNQWAAKEFEYYNTYLDYKQQLQRWVDNNQSPNYLLPIGPLTYFEKWFHESRPNAWWLRRYDLADDSHDEKLVLAQETLTLSNTFLKKSESKLRVTRTFMRFGAGRIILTSAGAVLLIVGCAFAYTWWKHQNDYVIDHVIADGKNLMQTRQASVVNKAAFAIMAERMKPGTLQKILKETSDPQDRINLLNYIAATIMQMNPHHLAPLYHRSFTSADSLITIQPQPDVANARAVSRYLTGYNNLLNVGNDYVYFHSDENVEKQLKRQAQNLSRFLFRLLSAPATSDQLDKNALNISITHCINFKAYSQDSLALLIKTLSPLEGNDDAVARFEKFFPANENIQIAAGGSIEHNGGYEMMAHLYATRGDADKVLQCMDTVLKYRSTYESNFNNGANIIGTFLHYSTLEKAKRFTDLYAAKNKLTSSDYLKAMARRAGLINYTTANKYMSDGNFNTNLVALTDIELANFYELYNSAITENYKNPVECDFALAMAYKQYGSVLAKKRLVNELQVDTATVNGLFQRAVDLYDKLPATFLQESVTATVAEPGGGVTDQLIPRYRLFIYPDYFNTFVRTIGPGFGVYYSDVFFKFIYQRKLISKWYHTVDDYAMIAEWIDHSFGLLNTTGIFSTTNQYYLSYPRIDRKMLDVADSILTNSGYEKQLDNSWIKLIKINEALEHHDKKSALDQLAHLNLEQMAYTRRLFFMRVAQENLAAKTGNQFLKAGMPAEALQFVYRNKAREARLVSFAELGIAAAENGMMAEAKIYLDSSRYAYTHAPVSENAYGSFWDVRNPMVRLIALLNGDDGKREILELTGDMANLKIQGLTVLVEALASTGSYHDAVVAIPTLTNADDRLILYSNILFVAISENHPRQDDPWREFDVEKYNLTRYAIYPQELF